MAQADKRKSGSAVLDEVANRTLEEMTGRIVVLGRDRGQPREVLISKLSIDQWLGVTFLAVRIAQKLSGDQKEVLETIQKGGGDDNWAAMVPLFLNKDNLLALIAILAQVSERWLEEHFSMAEVVELLDAVDEQEDLRRIIAPFRRIANRWQQSPLGQPRP